MSQIIGDERPHLLAQSLRRFAGVVVLLALVGAALSGAYAASRPEVYSSSSRILLRPSTGNPYSVETGPSSQQVTIAMTTEAALVDSDPVLQLVNEKLAWHLASNDVTVSVPANTSTIVATVQAPDAARAQEGAQAVADGYLAYRRGVTLATRKTSVDQLNRQITAVKASLAKVSDATSAGVATTQDARQAQVLTEQLISLQDLLNSAESIDANPGTLVSPAALGTRTGVGSWLIITAGVLIGIMIGTALALWLGRRDRRVHARAGSVVAGVPVLAILQGQAAADSGETDRQAYQRLRTSVLASSALPSAVAVSGVGVDDSSSPVALQLGRSMTRAGYKVALVMATAEEQGPFRDDSRGARGLADALRGGDDLADLLVEHDGLAVLSAGSGITEQQELLSGERFGRVVNELKSDFDYVLVVTGAAVLPAELATARLADALLLVGRDGVTSRVDIADVSARARLVGLRVTGLALRARRSRVAAVSRREPVPQQPGAQVPGPQEPGAHKSRSQEPAREHGTKAPRGPKTVQPSASDANGERRESSRIAAKRS